VLSNDGSRYRPPLQTQPVTLFQRDRTFHPGQDGIDPSGTIRILSYAWESAAHRSPG